MIHLPKEVNQTKTPLGIPHRFRSNAKCFKPSAGEVFRYPFLLKREQMAGETEGRKARPVCIAVTVAKSDSETVVFILPITTQPPLA